MPSVDVVDLNNQVVSSLELADEVFNAPVERTSAVRSGAAFAGRAARRKREDQDAARSFRIRQKAVAAKGHGRARMGSIRSPLWRHGGTTHGPQPRDYSYKLPRKMLLGALRSALSAKLRDGELKIVQEFSLPDHKSKGMRAVLTQLEVANKVLVVENGENRNLTLGTRNLEGVTLVESKDVSVYLLLGHNQVLLSETAAKKLSEALAK